MLPKHILHGTENRKVIYLRLFDTCPKKMNEEKNDKMVFTGLLGNGLQTRWDNNTHDTNHIIITTCFIIMRIQLTTK